MTSPENATQRLIIGVSGAACLVISAAMWFGLPAHDGVRAALMRVGLVMSALWLALPPQGRNVAWTKAVPIIVGLVILIVASRKAFLALLPLVVVVALAALFVRPRGRR